MKANMAVSEHVRLKYALEFVKALFRVGVLTSKHAPRYALVRVRWRLTYR